MGQSKQSSAAFCAFLFLHRNVPMGMRRLAMARAGKRRHVDDFEEVMVVARRLENRVKIWR